MPIVRTLGTKLWQRAFSRIQTTTTRPHLHNLSSLWLARGKKADESKDASVKPSEEKKEDKLKDNKPELPKLPFLNLGKPKRKQGGSDQDDDDSERDEKRSQHQQLILRLVAGVGALTSFGVWYVVTARSRSNEISWQYFRDNLLGTPTVRSVHITNDQTVDVTLADGSTRWFGIPNGKTFEERVLAAQVHAAATGPEGTPTPASSPAAWLDYHYVHSLTLEGVFSMTSMALWGILLFSFIRSNPANMEQTIMGRFNKLKSINVQGKIETRFKDVAGVDAAKKEIMEFVSYLKDPERFTKLGAKVPNGALLMGPPGTGKTLLAKAVAGESDVPFLSHSGSDFVEMFVGVGPSRVRNLFAEAKKHKRAIIFLDEIDAIGRPRGSGLFRNDERENTLNALLVEMDGFSKQEQGQIIVLASTNVATKDLDPALLRPGRFDRQINIDRPELQERQEIFDVHLSKIKLIDRKGMLKDEEDRILTVQAAQKAAGLEDQKEMDTFTHADSLAGELTDEELEKKREDLSKTENDLLVQHKMSYRLASLTPGFVGADIANMCNEGALIAAREKSDVVRLVHLEKAVDRVIGGIERKTKVLSDFEKRVVAYHEAGHAITNWFLKYSHPLMKVSIIPRGVAALGYAQMLPREFKINTPEQLFHQMCGLLGGRVAELLTFSHLSTGAQNDLQQITRLAYAQVATYSMIDRTRHVSFPIPGSSGTNWSKPYSEDLADKFDSEVKTLVNQAFEKTKAILTEKSKELKLVAEYLIKHEVITREDFIKLVGPRPFPDHHGEHPDDDTVPADYVVAQLEQPQNQNTTTTDTSSPTATTETQETETTGKTEGAADTDPAEK